jgi:hypothetical protein
MMVVEGWTSPTYVVEHHATLLVYWEYVPEDLVVEK